MLLGRGDEAVTHPRLAPHGGQFAGEHDGREALATDRVERTHPAVTRVLQHTVGIEQDGSRITHVATLRLKGASPETVVGPSTPGASRRIGRAPDVMRRQGLDPLIGRRSADHDLLGDASAGAAGDAASAEASPLT